VRTAYFDTAFVVKCYIREVDSEPVRALARETDELITSDLTRAEFAAAVHRKRREGVITPAEAQAVLAQFDADCSDRVWTFLPVNAVVLQRVTSAFASLPDSFALRAADAIHCASAAERVLDAIYSNDRQLLGASSHFNLRGVDITAT